MNRITAEQFEQAFAERFGMTVEELRALGRVVIPCECGVESCAGWQSVSHDVAASALRLPIARRRTGQSDEHRADQRLLADDAWF